jgi:hypothetical protein
MAAAAPHHHSRGSGAAAAPMIQSGAKASIPKATTMAAFMNSPSAIAVRTATWVWRRVMSK